MRKHKKTIALADFPIHYEEMPLKVYGLVIKRLVIKRPKIKTKRYKLNSYSATEISKRLRVGHCASSKRIARTG
jgi:hypothetical protein